MAKGRIWIQGLCWSTPTWWKKYFFKNLINTCFVMKEIHCYLMESTLRAPDGDITVILVPEHHQAHKEICKDKRDNSISLYCFHDDGTRAQGLPFLSEHFNKTVFQVSLCLKVSPSSLNPCFRIAKVFICTSHCVPAADLVWKLSWAKLPIHDGVECALGEKTIVALISLV